MPSEKRDPEPKSAQASNNAGQVVQKDVGRIEQKVEAASATATGNQLTVNLGDLVPKALAEHAAKPVEQPVNLAGTEPEIPNLAMDFVRPNISEEGGVFRFDESGNQCLAVLVHNVAAAAGEFGLDARSVFTSLTFARGTSRTVVNRACWILHEQNEIPIEISDTAHILIGFPFLKEGEWISVNNPNRFGHDTLEWNQPLFDLEPRTVSWYDGITMTVDVQIVSTATSTRGQTFAHKKIQLSRTGSGYNAQWLH
jgi:hypothetical protein